MHKKAKEAPHAGVPCLSWRDRVRPANTGASGSEVAADLCTPAPPRVQGGGALQAPALHGRLAEEIVPEGRWGQTAYRSGTHLIDKIKASPAAAPPIDAGSSMGRIPLVNTLICPPPRGNSARTCRTA